MRGYITADRPNDDSKVCLHALRMPTFEELEQKYLQYRREKLHERVY